MERLQRLASAHATLPRLLAAGLLLRVVLLVAGEIQDRTSVVKYTDIDYVVFTDGARFVAEGGSPFERATYRYTPLLAYLVLPCIYFHMLWGKLLFVACDLVIGVLLHRILDLYSPSLPPARKVAYVAVWVLNPIAANMSTRGSAESVMGVLVLATLWCVLTNRLVRGAMLFGLAVHFKIYPIIYAPTFVMLLVDAPRVRTSVGGWLRALLHVRVLSFAVCSAGVFLALGAAMYACYGHAFLQHTYLYHLTRTDHRHNFSVYFYLLYLTFGKPVGMGVGLAAFAPQAALLLTTALTHARDLPFAVFTQTLVFVAFNKVVTAQYFAWWLTLLPLVLPGCGVGWRLGLVLIAGWFAGELHWLAWGYQLEFLGESVFPGVFAAGLLFFLVNMGILFTLTVRRERVEWATLLPHHKRAKANKGL